YSPSNAPLGGGALGRLAFAVKGTAPTGPSALTFSAALLGNAAASSIAPTDLNPGSVEVLAALPPRVESIGTVADTGDGEVVEGEVTRAPLTQLVVRFSSPVRNPAGNTEPGDVTNPASYRIAAAGADGALQTVSCASGVPAGDTAVPVTAVTYESASTTAVLKVGGGLALPHGVYRLLVCGTIAGPEGVALDGNGDGAPGDDAALAFHLGVTNLLGNPNFDGDLASWIPVSPGTNEIRRVAEDSDGALTSGSAEVVNLSGTAQVFSLAQCVALTGPGRYGLGGRIRLSSGRTTAPSGFTVVDFHAGPGCTGAVLGTGLTPAIRGDTSGVWAVLGGFVRAPEGAVSALVMFVLDAGSSPDFTAGLDQLLFQRDEVFGNGFEAGSTVPWERTPD
ncbi:MAG: hypothetical protein ACLGI9_11800, partial [Thermoanaerobaculia bacterium]